MSQSCIFSIVVSVSRDPSEIILIWWFVDFIINTGCVFEVTCQLDVYVIWEQQLLEQNQISAAKITRKYQRIKSKVKIIKTVIPNSKGNNFLVIISKIFLYLEIAIFVQLLYNDFQKPFWKSNSNFVIEIFGIRK